MADFKSVSSIVAALAFWLVVTGCGSDSGGAIVESSDTSNVSDANGDDAETNGETGDEVSADNTAGGGNGSDSDSDTDGSTNPDIGSNTDSETPVAVDNREFEAVYSVRFVATWSAETHPTNFPSDPHFSPLTGAVHNEQVVIWQRGQNATDGIEDMAETGGTGQLLQEIQFAIDQGYALSGIEGGGISNSPGSTAVDILVNRDYPLVTVVSMLAPSPDWFIGIDRQSLIDSNGEFIDSLTLELNLYDSGTDGGMRFTSADEDIPRSPIGLVNSFPGDSDFLDGQPAVGSLEFTRTQ